MRIYPMISITTNVTVVVKRYEYSVTYTPEILARTVLRAFFGDDAGFVKLNAGGRLRAVRAVAELTGW